MKVFIINFTFLKPFLFKVLPWFLWLRFHLHAIRGCQPMWRTIEPLMVMLIGGAVEGVAEKRRTSGASGGGRWNGWQGRNSDRVGPFPSFVCFVAARWQFFNDLFPALKSHLHMPPYFFNFPGFFQSCVWCQSQSPVPCFIFFRGVKNCNRFVFVSVWLGSFWFRPFEFYLMKLRGRVFQIVISFNSFWAIFIGNFHSNQVEKRVSGYLENLYIFQRLQGRNWNKLVNIYPK